MLLTSILSRIRSQPYFLEKPERSMAAGTRGFGFLQQAVACGDDAACLLGWLAVCGFVTKRVPANASLPSRPWLLYKDVYCVVYLHGIRVLRMCGGLCCRKLLAICFLFARANRAPLHPPKVPISVLVPLSAAIFVAFQDSLPYPASFPDAQTAGPGVVSLVPRRLDCPF